MKTTKTKTQSLGASSYCTYCGSHELRYDVHTAELDCLDCGWPIQDQHPAPVQVPKVLQKSTPRG